MIDVYVIKSSSTGKIYIGQTRDISTRLKRHNGEIINNKKSYTYKNAGPWQVVYKEEFELRVEALKRERYLQSHVGRDYLKNMGV